MCWFLEHEMCMYQLVVGQREESCLCLMSPWFGAAGLKIRCEDQGETTEKN